MGINQRISPAEIHKIGIKAVVEFLRRSGHKVVTVNTHPKSNPQIVACMDRELAFIIVRTANFPRKGRLFTDTIINRMVAHASSHKAVCYFASLGITDLETGLDYVSEESAFFPDGMIVAVEGVDYFVSFSGFDLLTTPRDRFWQN
jgi:hypothetical protein